MEDIFYGEWYIEVSQKNASYNQRFRIIGSDSNDGIYQGIPGLILNRVTGKEWKLVLEWNDGNNSDWHPSGMQKTATYTINDGLVKTLGADDNFEWNRDFDFDDLVITCRSLDPSLNPMYPSRNPFDFTFPQEYLTEKCKEDYGKAYKSGSH